LPLRRTRGAILALIGGHPGTRARIAAPGLVSAPLVAAGESGAQNLDKFTKFKAENTT